uniref:HDC09233 n=1 Tax=Drosophila melanogaster TaxID=7227 RepID=Q6ILK2_DROME|nr:TPA_inf: HDC09233 [Drosophila melanogaster]
MLGKLPNCRCIFTVQLSGRQSDLGNENSNNGATTWEKRLGKELKEQDQQKQDQNSQLEPQLVFAVFVFISAVSVLPHFPVSLFPRFPTKDFVLTASGTEANAYAEISKSWFRPFCCAVKNSSKCLWVAHTFAFSLQPPDSRFQPPSAFSGGKCDWLAGDGDSDGDG